MKQILILTIVILTILGCKKESHSEANNDLKNEAQRLASKASWLINEGNYVDAIPLLLEASKLRPMCAEYHVGLGMACVKTEDYKTAEDRYKKALTILLEQSNDDPERIDDLVMVLIYLKRDEEAYSTIKQAQNRFDDNQTISVLASNNFQEVIEESGEYRIKP